MRQNISDGDCFIRKSLGGQRTRGFLSSWFEEREADERLTPRERQILHSIPRLGEILPAFRGKDACLGQLRGWRRRSLLLRARFAWLPRGPAPQSLRRRAVPLALDQ